MSDFNKKPRRTLARSRRTARPLYKPAHVELTWDNLAQLLKRPIAYQPIFSYITGDANAGLFLSQAFYWTNIKLFSDPKSDGWFYKTELEWFLETGLTKWEQRTAKRTVTNLKLMQIDKRGWPATNHFFINRPLLLRSLARYLPDAPSQTRVGKVGAKSTDKSLADAPTITEQRLPQRKSYSVTTENTEFVWPDSTEAEQLTLRVEQLNPQEVDGLLFRFEIETEPAKKAGVASEEWLQLKWIIILRRYFYSPVPQNEED
jgi:hypothetical protein